MKIYIGVGTTTAQEFPFKVLKHTLLKQNPGHELIIEDISKTIEYQQISPKIEATYGTVFSLQRFLVPKIAMRHGADICMHLDSDMTCHKSLQAFFDMVVQNPNKIILPSPNPNYKQPQQTAVFGCLVGEWALNIFESNLENFLTHKINYVDLMRLSFSEDNIVKCSHIYNSRELYEKDTVILHVTDLYRQPWVNRFNSLKHVWFEAAKDALESNPDLGDILKDGVEKKYYLPSILNLVRPVSFIYEIKDFFFLPPQFNAYAAKKFGAMYQKKIIGTLLKFGVTMWVQSVAFLHDIKKHRLI